MICFGLPLAKIFNKYEIQFFPSIQIKCIIMLNHHFPEEKSTYGKIIKCIIMLNNHFPEKILWESLILFI